MVRDKVRGFIRKTFWIVCFPMFPFVVLAYYLIAPDFCAPDTMKDSAKENLNTWKKLYKGEM